MRTERSGRDGPGPSVRGGPPSSRGRSSFSERDGKSMTINNQVSSLQRPERCLFLPFFSGGVTRLTPPPSPQPFSSGRQVVVERHSRDSGLRKEWQGGSNSQERAFPDNRRMESRGSLMGSSRYGSFSPRRRVL